MSEEPQEPQEEKPLASVFAESETPEEGAERIDESGPDGKEILPDGNMRQTVSTDGQDLYDHADETAAVHDKQVADGTAAPDMPDREMIGVRNPGVMADATDDLRDEIEARFKDEFGGRTVEVTADERAAFVRAALHDTELIFEIPVEGLGTTVLVALPPDSFTNAASAAANLWAREGFIDEDSQLQWLLTFQQMHAWYQVRSIGGEPTPWSVFWGDGPPSHAQTREFLSQVENFEDFQKMNAVRWRMILDAIRTAELKYKICLTNWQDRTFFTGADTA